MTSTTRILRRLRVGLLACALASAAATAAASPPGVTIQVNAVPAGPIAAGQTATFEVVVDNPALNVGSYAAGVDFDVTVGGNALTAPAGDTLADAILAPGETWTYTSTANGSLAVGSSTADPCPDVTLTAVLASLPTDPSPAQGSAAVVTLCSDLVTSVAAPTSTVPGTATSWTATITNTGPDALTGGVSVTPTLPAAALLTCTVGCGPTVTPTLGPGASFVHTISGTIPAGAGAGPIAVSLAAGAAPGAFDPGANNSATRTSTLTPQADLSVTATPGPGTYTPGLSHSLSWDVTSAVSSPSTVTITPSVGVVSVLTGATWTCTGAPCQSPGPSGSPSQLVLAPGQSANLTLTGATAAAATALAGATLTATSPGGDATANNSAADADIAQPSGDIVVASVEGAATYTPGLLHEIAFTVENAATSPSTMRTTPAASAVAVLTGVSWVCENTAATGACGAASGAPGDPLPALTLDPGESVTLRLSGDTQPGDILAAAATLGATADAGSVDTGPGANSASDTDAALPSGNLAVSLTRTPPTFIANQGIDYVLTVQNSGPSHLSGVNVRDVVPDSIGPVSWSCTATGAATQCGGPSGSDNDINETVNVGVGGQVVYAIHGTIEVSHQAGLPIYNTATATVSPTSVDPVPANNTATTPALAPGQVEVVASITDGRTSYVPGLAHGYVIQVTNASPTAVTDVPVTVPVPAAFTNAAWTCSPSAGSSCSVAGGQGPIAITVSLAGGGGRATLALNGTSSSAATTPLAMSVTAASVNDVNPDNNVDVTDTDTAAPSADISVSLTDGSATYVPGTPVAYTLRVANEGPSDAPVVTMGTSLSPLLAATTWSCTSGCVGSGTGNVGAVASLPAGAEAVIAVTGQSAPADREAISSSASAQITSGPADPAPANNAASDTDTAAPQADLRVAISDSAATYTPGAAVTYVVVVTNAGPSAVAGARVSAQIGAGLSGVRWSCLSGCTGSGAGPLDRLLDLGAGERVDFTLSAQASAAATGDITTVATLQAPAGVADLAPGNNASSDTDAPRPRTDLKVAIAPASASAVPGGADVVQTITATNDGPSDASGVTVDFVIPPGLRLIQIQTPRGSCQGVQELSCALGSLGSGDSVQIRAVLTAVTAGPARATATIGGDQSDPATANNTDSATVEVASQSAPAAVVAARSARTLVTVLVQGPRVPRAGSQARYVITVTNTGRVAARGVQVAATIPLGARLAGAKGKAGAARKVVRWKIARLRPGTARTFVLALVAERSGVAGPPLRIAAENLARSPRIRRIHLSAPGGS